MIIHWYSGPWDVLEAMVENGFYFTIGVEVLLSQHIQDIARSLPAELMLAETDNPGGKQSLTGTIGTPLPLKDVIRKLAEIRRTSDQVIITAVHNKLVRLGDDDPWLARLQASAG